MLDKDSDRLPPAVRRIVGSMRVIGGVSLWSQGILAVVATLSLIFSSAVLTLENNTGPEVARDNPGAGVGFLFAAIALLLLYAGTFWAFRYTRISRKLRARDGRERPKPGAVIRALKLGLILNLAGTFASLLGDGAWTGALMAKAFAQGPGQFGVPQAITQTIQGLDILVLQSIVIIQLAHFIGLMASLWLVQSMES